MSSAVPRPEYPRPQYRRRDWFCLNGRWQFEIDQGDSGEERGLVARALKREIVVPFCPESKLSGVEETDFLNAVWYRREVETPAGWGARRLRLHFGAVDYQATVWIDGAKLAEHRGGFTPFWVDLPETYAGGARFTVVVRARDDHRESKPRGKQSERHDNYSCLYTRTTGIWQTVWLEPLGEARMGRPRITPKVEAGGFWLEVPLEGRVRGSRLVAELRDAAGVVAGADIAVGADFAAAAWLAVPAGRRRPWCPDDSFLYEITLRLIGADGAVLDEVESYAGLRGLSIDGETLRLNGRVLFQRLVLDQGFYPDGLMTAPDDAALVRDIELGLAAGFNGARLHQKIFEERFLYHADRLGYLVWGEFPDWPAVGFRRLDHRMQPDTSFVAQWLEALARDYSHPCIVGWCPLNETSWTQADNRADHDELVWALFRATKAADRTRPVIDVSGFAHRVPETDVYDSHDYTQDPAVLLARVDGAVPMQGMIDQVTTPSTPYAGQPRFVSEFGGIWWNPEAKPGEASWGYGDRPKSEAEFLARFEGMCAGLLAHPGVAAYCYTQLTDVFQEQNGLYTFERRPKFDLIQLRRAQAGPAAIEVLVGDA